MSNSPAQSNPWKDLQAHAKAVEPLHMRDLFKQDAKRFQKFHTTIKGLTLDYSRHRATDETLSLLLALAKSAGIEKERERMFKGDIINTSENRAVLHTALRGSGDPKLTIDGENVASFVKNTLAQIKTIAEKIRADKTITDVLAIGIGGSDLGPRIVCETLHNFKNGPRVFFVSNVDGARISGVLKILKPESTAFIVVSKTFTTMETLTNAETAKEWAGSTKKFYAVTAKTETAEKFGIAKENILPMRDWIGGRVSLWSSVGLPIAVAIGFDNFEKLLSGAKAMDDHFRTAPFEKNIPVLMALLTVWYRNFMDYRTHAVLPYKHNLRKFPAFVQQLEMESNGKSVNLDGQPITDYKTSPVIFGETGTNAQHAFMQLMHQGTDIIPADFIIVKEPGHNLIDHHKKLNANALAQAQALMAGRLKPKEPHQAFPGNRPSSTLILERLDPWHLGLLLALYEHKMEVQGIIWNINSFDQWGVELGKQLANRILDPDDESAADQTTDALMKILEE